MKKLINILLISLIISAVFNLAYAVTSCRKSVALTNWSNNTVTFTTPADPGYLPQVQKDFDYILPGDFMVSCSKKACTIMILPVNSRKYTTINNVPRGSRIYYYHRGHDGYVIKNEGVCIP